MPSGLPSLPNDAIASYHFAVEIDGVEIAQFAEISGITSEMDVIEYSEVTPDGKSLIRKVPGKKKPPTITLKRAKNVSTSLWDWHYQAKQGQVGEARRNGSVILFDYLNGEVARYNFINAWPSKITMGTLKAGSNEMLMEECAIVCEDLERVVMTARDRSGGDERRARQPGGAADRVPVRPSARVRGRGRDGPSRGLDAARHGP